MRIIRRIAGCQAVNQGLEQGCFPCAGSPADQHMVVGKEIHSHRILALRFRAVCQADRRGQGIALRLLHLLQILQIHLGGQRGQPDLAQRRNFILRGQLVHIAHQGVQLRYLFYIIGFLFLFLLRHAGFSDQVDQLHLDVFIVRIGHIRLIFRAGPAGLELLKDLIVAHLEVSPSRPGNRGCVGPLEHLLGILLIRHPKAQAEAGVAPNLIVHYAGRLLGSQDQVHAQAPPYAGRADQGPHELRLLLFQLRKLVRDNQQMGHRLRGHAAAVQLDIGIDVLHLVIVKYLLPVLDLRIDGKQGPVGGVPAQVRDHAGQVRQADKALGHASALIIDQDKGYLMGMVAYRQRQDIGLEGLGFTGSCRSCHQAMGAVVFFMNIQIQGLLSRLIADHGLHALIGAVFQPFMDNIQRFHI